ncbi:hypothetical protein [Aquamicrobium sp. LC103]|uniref:hypothetical protein n=1 Tax=Aquamicrobium sp. LC103 TaxID=1120658 RepID=UPI00063E7560|nr:hypothetical protein [Aquamicrobium sp. LC103]TKT76780.1 hypothetical protein XW59_015040 [Aquamicrobium sp. LC103]
MSLSLLVVMVAVGIAGVVGVVHLTGGSRVATLVGEEAARLRFADDFPDARVASLRLTCDRRTAFLGLEEGGCGLVHAIGGKFMTRLLCSADVAATPRASGSAIAIKLRDFSWKGGTFQFEDEAAALEVEAMFTRIRQNGIWERK